MLPFVLQKLKNKRWMALCLLLGNIMLIALAVATPMYAQAVLQRTLTKKLTSLISRDETYPGIFSAELGVGLSDGTEIFPRLDQTDEVFRALPAQTGLDSRGLCIMRTAELAVTSDTSPHADEIRLIRLRSMTELEEHITLTHGRLYDPELQDHTLEAVVSQQTLLEQGFQLDELIRTTLPAPDGGFYSLRIVGVFTVSDRTDPYWPQDPGKWENVCLISDPHFRQAAMNPQASTVNFRVTWRQTLDYTQVTEPRVEEILQALSLWRAQLKRLEIPTLSAGFENALLLFRQQAVRVNTTLWVLLIPIIALMGAFVFMVTQQLLEMERDEISVFKSRGASRWQIIRIYLLQSMLMTALSLALGIPLGYLLCRIIGSANAFMEFVQRTGLPVDITDRRVWLSVGAAVLFSICAMVLPVLRYARVGIVEAKLKKKRIRLPWWQLCGLDVIALALSLYGLDQYRGKEDYLAQLVLEGTGLDPLLYICSTLFMLGAGLLFVRLFPLFIRLLFMLGKKLWPPALYASFQRITRSRNHQAFIMVFLIMTVAMGIFSAQTARTVNANGELQLRYKNGAELVIREHWELEEFTQHYSLYDYENEENKSVASDTVTAIYQDPGSEKYLGLEGVAHATKVQNETVDVVMKDAQVPNVQLLGIHTREFGETAWFQSDLMPIHWHQYLNALAERPNGVLVSANFRDVYGWQLGDSIQLTNTMRQRLTVTVCGFIDYWPGYTAVTQHRAADGSFQKLQHYLVVANISKLQSAWGIRPYEVWIDAQDSTQFVYDFAENSGGEFVKFQDTSSDLVKLKNDPVLQGTNGVLTVGFVAILILCAAGFLIYWILSIQSRTLQFGIYRAMGMTMGEVLAMLVTEQVFISGLAIAVGALVGKIASNLYIPLIQIVYSAADRAIPLEIISDPGDDLRLAVVIGLMILVCMVILSVLISRIRISQALKLGED